jgi:hypothetical protein
MIFKFMAVKNSYFLQDSKFLCERLKEKGIRTNTIT